MNQLPSTPAALVRVDSRLQSRSLKSELAALDADDLALIGKVCSHGTTRQRLRRFGGLVAVGIGAVALIYLPGTGGSIAAVAMTAVFGVAFRRINRSDATRELVDAGFDPTLAAELGRAAAELPWNQQTNMRLPTSALERGQLVVEAAEKVRSSS